HPGAHLPQGPERVRHRGPLRQRGRRDGLGPLGGRARRGGRRGQGGGGIGGGRGLRLLRRAPLAGHARRPPLRIGRGGVGRWRGGGGLALLGRLRLAARRLRLLGGRGGGVGGGRVPGRGRIALRRPDRDVDVTAQRGGADLLAGRRGGGVGPAGGVRAGRRAVGGRGLGGRRAGGARIRGGRVRGPDAGR